MTKKNVFGFSGYKTYLQHRLNAAGARSGLRAAFARALGCQSSFVSQVVGGALHLSLEQALKANEFLEHTEDETHFFMLLVQKDRAGTAELRRYHQKQIDAVIAGRNKIKSRLSRMQELSDDHKAKYYSRWEYGAIHMALALPNMRTPSSISHGLKIPLSRVEQVLSFFLESGLASLSGSEYRIGNVHLHLGSDSPYVNQHHTNWRLEALKRMEAGNSENLHYSAVYSISREDFQRLKENQLNAIQRGVEIVKPSPEEMLVCQMIDIIPL